MQLAASADPRAIARRLSDLIPEIGPPLKALALVAVATALFGVAAPALDGGPRLMLAPLALGVAAAILIKPEVGLALVFLAAPLETTYLDMGVRVKPQQVIGLVTMAGWALQFALGHRHLIRGSTLNTPLFLLVLTFLLSFIVHSDVMSFGIGLFGLQLWFVLMIFLLANFVDEPGLLRRCFWMFVVAGVLEALLAIVQAAGFYHTAEQGVTTYGAVLLEGRPAGTFSEPDFLAPFLMGSFLLILPFWGVKKIGSWTPLFYLAPIVLLAASILALVRASWLGLFAGLLAFAWLKLRERGGFNVGALLRRTIAVLVAISFLIVLLSFVWPTAYSAVTVRARNIVTIVEPENPHKTRLNEVEETWNTIKGDLLTGHGVGTFSITTDYGRGIAQGRGQSRGGVVGSGTPLGLLHDFGVVGLAVFAFLIGTLLWRLSRAIKAASPAQQPYLQGTFACLIGLTVSACFNNLYYFGYYWLIIALAAALATPALVAHKKKRCETEPKGL